VRVADAIAAAVTDLDRGPEARIIVLTSQGERAFAAGSDIGEHYGRGGARA